MAQPNFQNLSQYLIAASQQIALIPNLPIMGIGHLMANYQHQHAAALEQQAQHHAATLEQQAQHHAAALEQQAQYHNAEMANIQVIIQRLEVLQQR